MKNGAKRRVRFSERQEGSGEGGKSRITTTSLRCMRRCNTVGVGGGIYARGRQAPGSRLSRNIQLTCILGTEHGCNIHLLRTTRVGQDNLQSANGMQMIFFYRLIKTGKY
jgi:hypothetical protein